MIVADDQIVGRIVEILNRADLTTITFAAIRRQLEEDFRTDLTDKKAFIREQVDLYLQFQQRSHHQQQHHHQQQQILLQQQQQQQQQQQRHHHQHLQQQQQQHQLQHFRDLHPSQHPLQHFRRDIDLLLPHASSEDPEIDDTVQIIVEEEYEEPDASVFQENALSTSKRK